MIYGAVRDRIALGLAGLVASGVAGLVLGLILAIPVAAVFAYLIYGSTRSPASETGAGQTGA